MSFCPLLSDIHTGLVLGLTAGQAWILHDIFTLDGVSGIWDRPVLDLCVLEHACKIAPWGSKIQKG